MLDDLREIAQWILIFALAIKVIILERRLRAIESVGVRIGVSFERADQPKQGRRAEKPERPN